MLMQDNKSNLGPGYYEEDKNLAKIKLKYQQITRFGRTKINIPLHGAFSSTAERNQPKSLSRNNYQGPDFFDTHRSSVVKNSFNTKYLKLNLTPTRKPLHPLKKNPRQSTD